MQFLNQVILFALLFFVFRVAIGLDRGLKRLPGKVKKCIDCISSITLEIYVVQYVLIELARNWQLVFPLNWGVLTASILISAFALHMVCQVLHVTADKMIANR